MAGACSLRKADSRFKRSQPSSGQIGKMGPSMEAPCLATAVRTKVADTSKDARALLGGRHPIASRPPIVTAHGTTDASAKFPPRDDQPPWLQRPPDRADPRTLRYDQAGRIAPDQQIGGGPSSPTRMSTVWLFPASLSASQSTQVAANVAARSKRRRLSATPASSAFRFELGKKLPWRCP